MKVAETAPKPPKLEILTGTRTGPPVIEVTFGIETALKHEGDAVGVAVAVAVGVAVDVAVEVEVDVAVDVAVEVLVGVADEVTEMLPLAVTATGVPSLKRNPG